MNKATFYIVSTPIGNLKDISYRAIEILKTVDVIYSEDTRVTRRLLDEYTIDTALKSYHANSSQFKEDEIISLLEDGIEKLNDQ